MKPEKSDPSIQTFVSLVQQGIEKWIEAGRLVSDKLDEDPEWAEKASDAVPGLTIETIMRFDALGRNRLVPQLLLNDCPGFRALSRCPYEIQTRYVSNPVPLLIEGESGWETLQIGVESMTPDQVRQVFERGSIRTEAQQRAWIETRRSNKPPEIEVSEPYVIRGGKVHFKSACVVTVADLANIIQRATR